MYNDELLGRIWANPKTFGGKPTIRDTRVPVELILGFLAVGETIETLLDQYPGLERDDILACLAYAHAALAGDRIDAVRVVGA